MLIYRVQFQARFPHPGQCGSTQGEPTELNGTARGCGCCRGTGCCGFPKFLVQISRKPFSCGTWWDFYRCFATSNLLASWGNPIINPSFAIWDQDKPYPMVNLFSRAPQQPPCGHHLQRWPGPSENGHHHPWHRWCYPEAHLDTSTQTVSQHDCKQLHTPPETRQAKFVEFGKWHRTGSWCWLQLKHFTTFYLFYPI